MPNSKFAGRQWLAAVAAICAVTRAAHAEVEYSFDAGVGRSDNITRVADDEVEETIGMLGLQLSWLEETRRLNANLLGDIAYLEYMDGTYDSEVTGNFVGSMLLHAIPERLDWVIEDNFGQARRDPLAPVTPDNREDVNVFSTGPDFVMGLGVPNLDARISARYMNVAYEDSEFDNDGFSGLLSVERTMSSNAVLSAHAGTSQIRPKNEAVAGSEYDVFEYYLGYGLEAARTSFSIDAGITELERDGSTEDGFLLRLDILRQLSDRASSTSALVASTATPASRCASCRASTASTREANSVTANPDPFISEYVTFGWMPPAGARACP